MPDLLTPDRWRRAQALFHEAVEYAPEARSAVLDAACATDPGLRRVVERMLAADLDASAQLAPAADARPHPTAADLAARLQDALGDAYRVDAELPGGGMSRVFVAEEVALARRVVVKVLPPELGPALDVARFRREVRLAASLRHPHVVPLLAAGESADGLVYYTMPYIEGESLRARLRRDGPLPAPDAARVVREVADALAYAHRRGVVHRDVKPANVLVDGDHVLVSDFGIAKALSAAAERAADIGGERAPQTRRDGATLTSVGLAIGTPGYMSPEQARGDSDVDGRSDVYGLGCTAYELLTGERPAGSATGRMEPRTGLGAAVDQVIARALAADRDTRFPSPTDFADALGAALGGHAAVPARHRRTWVASVASVALAVTAGVAAAIAWRVRDAPPAAGGARPTVAVLPFESLGDAGDAHLTDGVTDELTTRLAGISRLRVLSRTSTRAYRGTTRPLPAIGRELGADYVLEGSVQVDRPPGARARIRVRPRLVRVADETPVWADALDAELEDVFVVEGAIGERVAAALDVALPGRERAALASRPTASFEAYNYFIRGEGLRVSGDYGPAWRRTVALYDSAVRLDPRFALALARLSEQHSDSYWNFYDRTDARLALARETAERALALAPDLPEAHLALGLYHYRGRRDYARALAAYSDGLRGHPEHGDLIQARAWVLRRMGRYREAAADLERVLALDPRSHARAWMLATTYCAMREYAQCERYLDRVTAIDPRWTMGHAERARLNLAWRGDLAAAARVVRDAMPVADPGQLMMRLFLHAPYLISPGPASDSVLARVTARSYAGGAGDYYLWRAHWHRVHGTPAAARRYADSARARLEADVRARPDDAVYVSRLALAHAFLGHREEARRLTARAVALLPVAVDAVAGAELLEDQAYVLLLVGDHEAAVATLERLVAIPSEVSVPMLRAHPMWAPLRGLPAFRRLVDTPGAR